MPAWLTYRVMPLTAYEVELFERSRARLEAIAYRLLGSASDAEDAVQETFLRWQAADRSAIRSPAAWLTTVLTNLCRNQLASARVRRETYVGMWLPEPLLPGDRMLGPGDTVEQRESVSIAMLTMMERLSPNERVVYVLREAFDYSHREIAELLDLSEANCQQLFRRAKQHLASGRTRVEVDAGTARTIVEEFVAAAGSGEVDRLVTLLTEDVMSAGDGGGQMPARSTPIVGALAVARFLRGLFTPNQSLRRMLGGSPVVYAEPANGDPALVVAVDGRVVTVMSLEVTSEGIAAIRIQLNPDKLERATRQFAGAAPGRPVIDSW